MQRKRLIEARDRYRNTLLHDVLPFWMQHIRDDDMGGYLHHVDADGSVVSTDKCFWVVGRTIWLFSRCYNEIEPRPEWLDFARHGFEFMEKYGFDTDGRMFYTVTGDGRPIRKRRYLFTETFGAIAMCEYGRATGDRLIIQRAKELYRTIVKLNKTPDASMPPKFYPARAMKSHAMPMIMVAMTQVLRQNGDDPLYAKVIDTSIREILTHFLHPEKHALFENVGPHGEVLTEIPEGRCLNPGHALETAWFLLEEARHRDDHDLKTAVLPIVDFSMERGWDADFGGLFYFVDSEGKPPEPYEHDMKLWWVQLEGLYANLLAYHLTGKERYQRWFQQLDEYCFRVFPDKVHGEWFGYCHRDGSLASTVKGSKWKAPFHLPRAMLNSWRLLDEMLSQPGNYEAGRPSGDAGH